MITCVCSGHNGRLGNSMFQYAAMIGTAEKNGYGCVFDYNDRGHLGNGFNLSFPKHMSREEQENNIKVKYSQPKYCYDEKTENLGEWTDIHGYFQTSKFFEGSEDIIRKEFTPIDEIKNSCDNLMKEVRSANKGRRVLSIHIRRGDYLFLSDHHPPLSLDYYNKAFFDTLGNLYSHIPVIFSDDIPYCKEVFNDTAIYAERGTSFHDMYLMSLCDDHIIANSSFSWWGAWLNPKEDKRVVAPQKWFGPSKNSEEYPMHDLYEKDWTII